MRTFCGIYNHAFPVKEMIIKLKYVLNLWMGKGPQKSSKKKRKPHDKFLKNLTYLLNEKRFENYKSLFKISKIKYKI